MEREWLRKALEAREKAYAPYSGFKVGAVLVGEDGQIYSGCNVENSSYGLSICAERVAIVKAVSQGVQRFSHLLVVGSQGLTYPCGACLQFMAEFSPDIKVVCASPQGEIKTFLLTDMLPYLFTLRR